MVQTIECNEPFISVPCELSEGVTYDPRNHSLSWIDIKLGNVFRTVLDSNDEPGEISKFHVDKYIGMIGLTSDVDKLLCAAAKTIGVLDLKTGQYSPIVEYPNGNVGENNWQLRSNDGSVDRNGDLWIGTMCDETCAEKREYGTLYFLDHSSLKLTPVIKKTAIPNGINWSHGKMFWTSSKEHTIYQFDTDSNGHPDVSSKTPFYRSAETFKDYSDKSYLVGEPDGSCVDADGNLYIAVWGTNRAIKIDTEGKLVAEYVFPANHISCTTIGGKNNDQLFVTSAHDDSLGSKDLGGAIFKVDLSKDGIKGVAKNVWCEGSVI